SSGSGEHLATAIDGYRAEEPVVSAPVDVVPAPPADPTLTAGNVDDNAKWEDYLRYRAKALAEAFPVHDVDIENREVVHVVDRDGKPVLGAHVDPLEGDTVLASRTTYADGRTLFFPPKSTGQDAVPHYTFRVTFGDAHAEQPSDAETHDHTITLDTS